MRFILAAIRSLFSRDSITTLFLNVSSFRSCVSLSNSTFGIVLARSRIGVSCPFVFTTHRNVSLIVTERLVRFILTAIRSLFSWNSVPSFFFNISCLTSSVGLSYSSFRIILARSWIGVSNKLVFSTNSHVSFIITKWLMWLVLSSIRRLLSGNSIIRFFFNVSSFRSSMSLVDCSFRVILSWCRIRISFPLVFATDCHVLFCVSEFFKMAIILSWIWCLFSWYSIITFFFNDGSLASCVSLSHCSFRIVLSRSRV